MEMMNYQPQRGLRKHREAGAQWISRQGYDVAAERLTVCGGAHHGVLVVLTAVTRPGDHIVSDSLTYPGIRSLARVLGLRLDGLARDAGGPLPDAFEEACRTHDVKAIYLCPNQQNPTSLTMPEQRRRELADIARRYEVAVVEDETLGFLAGSDPAPIAAPPPERALNLGGTSTTVAPAPCNGPLVPPAQRLARAA